MAVAITKNLERLPSHSLLSKLAAPNNVHVTGNEYNNSFPDRGTTGECEFGADFLHGAFAVHGLKGAFRFGFGQVTITITEKPFWLPEMLLKQKITDGFDPLGAALTQQPST